MSYKFSQQQIIGINYHYAKILAGSFDEDTIRLLLIHLREFLQNNTKAKGRVNANLLLELGDGVAHTVRNCGALHQKIINLVRRFARRGLRCHGQSLPFVLYDLDEIVSVFEKLLIDTRVVYLPESINAVFRQEAEDLKLCLISMLHGQIFNIRYEGIADDFHFLTVDHKSGISVRTELDLGHRGTRELRLNALLPCDGGGTYAQCLLRLELSDALKIDNAAYNRTASVEGYCEPVKVLRRHGRLVITTVPIGVSAMQVYEVFRAASYDTRPLSKRIDLVTRN
jgi:hypothetical protein